MEAPISSREHSGKYTITVKIIKIMPWNLHASMENYKSFINNILLQKFAVYYK